MAATTRTSTVLAFAALVLATPVLAQDAGYPQAQYGYATGGYNTDGQSVDSIAVFFEPLARYGRWLDSRFGRVWAPNVPRNWRPYTLGHWEEGAYGPTWRSDEPFGWAVFHFGRWAFDPAIGWVWHPDTTWGPGWVAWRDGDDIAGWAPLPPQVDAYVAAGVGGAVVNDWGYDAWYQPSWVFVPRGYLYARSLRGVYYPYARNHECWDRSRGVTRYDRVDGQIVNHSLARGRGDDPRYLRGDQNFTPRPGPQPGTDVAREASAPRDTFGQPRPFGERDGFVPGTARGFDRRPVAPGFVPRQPGFVPSHAPAVTVPRPMPPGAARPMPTFAPPPRSSPPPHPAPAPAAHERPR